MRSHAIATPNMRSLDAITGEAFGGRDVLRSAIGRFARLLGHLQQHPSPADPSSADPQGQPTISPFCVGQSPAPVTISQKDLYHAR